MVKANDLIFGTYSYVLINKLYLYAMFQLFANICVKRTEP